MTISKAKKLLKEYLDKQGLVYTKMMGKIVDFADLARGSTVLVTIYGWQPNPKYSDVKVFAHANGFCVEAQTSVRV